MSSENQGAYPSCADLLIQSLLDKMVYFNGYLSFWQTWFDNISKYENKQQTSDRLIVKCAEMFNDLSKKEDWLKSNGKRLYREVGYFCETTDITDFLKVEVVRDVLGRGLTLTSKLSEELLSSYLEVLTASNINTVADLVRLTEGEVLDLDNLSWKQRFKVADLNVMTRVFINKDCHIHDLDCKFTAWLIYSQMKSELDFNGDFYEITLEILERLLISNKELHRHHIRDAFTVGGSRSPSPVGSPPSRSPSIAARDEEYPGRGITPLPTKELWLYRYAYRLQQFGTTVIPLADQTTRETIGRNKKTWSGRGCESRQCHPYTSFQTRASERTGQG